ncbi:UDP-4-amino-4,6-dideoxy-N-acetyl-beta-L-altrosamine transaminase [Rhodocytophaga rosea]|uniref:UDP-4-amino-4, 6-dideoxy-N-acetyl-beta-L-altrosamine transaminase n=1 Tax=Rhodocytophaga rosea TaxID=2704465 RepID=A0A6C0GLA4_9BACT|nr:UDP-4-amino-4,6-dideoxy-N-acetyl-beta-L-altrosamine transaminase [Rhodocytophaga rosea]QHT68816.1 UDP-4-amino-4,6-dideoxy-N-acetyl-beta-L-altrosamine transaminase [Rhodocytophaga rosea]
MKAIPYGRQHINQEDIDAVVEVLKSDYLTQGPKIEELEKKFAQYIGSSYALAVSNGTAALHLCTLALNVSKGSNVITTPLTFVASANCVEYCGGNVYFADIDPDTYLLDINKVKALIESKPKGFFSGIIPVDFAGYPVDLEQYRQLAKEHNLWIVEDACHAPGGYFTDSTATQQWCGNSKFADLAIFSFHPVKHIATGEGGMITTNNEELYKKLLLLRTHGITKNADLLIENHGGWYYEMQELGYNYRLTDFQAALGISQLARADKGLQRRKEIARKYDEAFQGTSLKTPKPHPGHAYHLYVIQVENRLVLYNHLRNKNIFAQVHYIPVHLQPFYKQKGHTANEFPIVEEYYKHCLSIPMYPTLTDDEQQYIIDTINNYLATY